MLFTEIIAAYSKTLTKPINGLIFSGQNKMLPM